MFDSIWCNRLRWWDEDDVDANLFNKDDDEEEEEEDEVEEEEEDDDDDGVVLLCRVIVPLTTGGKWLTTSIAPSDEDVTDEENLLRGVEEADDEWIGWNGRTVCLNRAGWVLGKDEDEEVVVVGVGCGAG